jgi:tellurite resistance protein TerC
VIIGLLALDLGVFSRRLTPTSPRVAMGWTLGWVAAAVAFNAGVWWQLGHQKGLEFLTGYLVEEALSVDNLFVFLLVFSYFRVPREHQHRLLYWGVLGAFVLRGLFIFVGTALIARFHWLLYLFGAFLVYTGIKLVVTDEDDTVDPGHSPVVRLVRRIVPVTADYRGQAFVVREGGRLMATPLLIVLAVVETTDVMFAVDSIPAIFGVTIDPFIVYTSNVFAILGLRSLYFVLADFMDRFEYLKHGLGIVLAFVGAKMLLARFYELPITLSLAVIGGVLVGSVVFSLWKTRRRARHAARKGP